MKSCPDTSSARKSSGYPCWYAKLTHRRDSCSSLIQSDNEWIAVYMLLVRNVYIGTLRVDKAGECSCANIVRSLYCRNKEYFIWRQWKVSCDSKFNSSAGLESEVSHVSSVDLSFITVVTVMLLSILMLDARQLSNKPAGKTVDRRMQHPLCF